MQDPGEKIRILFLCTGNSCRSQMAEGWARRLHPALFEPFSAGVKPKGVDPLAVRVMAEAGVDISHQGSKHVDELTGGFDYVITVCDNARESCPVYTARVKTVHRAFEDPPLLARGAKDDEQALRHYRRVRDEIRDFIKELPGVLGIQQNTER